MRNGRYQQQEVDRRLAHLEAMVDRIDRSIEKMEIAVIVREPGSALAADAYNGLRKQIIAAVAERNAHLLQLVQFAEAIPVASRPELARLVDGWLDQAGVARIDDPSQSAVFDVLAGTGETVKVLRPAYVDRATGRPIMMGHAERVEASSPVASRSSTRASTRTAPDLLETAESSWSAPVRGRDDVAPTASDGTDLDTGPGLAAGAPAPAEDTSTVDVPGVTSDGADSR